MKALRYRLHFLLLTVAVALFWLATGVDLPYWFESFDFFHFGVMGLLHAVAIVASLRDRTAARPIIALCFIGLAIVWSGITPLLGLGGSIVWAPILNFLPPGDHNAVFLFITGSIIGAAGYWLLVRLFWLKFLRLADCLRTVLLCVVGTSLSFFVAESLPKTFPNRAFPTVLTAGWWFAFSLSLYWSEGSDKRREKPVLTAAIS